MEINIQVKEITWPGNIPRTALAVLWDKVACEMFEKLSQEEKTHWIEVAKEEHNEALMRWKDDCEDNCSTSSKDCQRCDWFSSSQFYWYLLMYRCIQGLIRFVQPILELIGEAIRWNCLIITGRPELAQGEWLNMIRLVIFWIGCNISDPYW